MSDEPTHRRPENLKALKDSIEEHGMQHPVKVKLNDRGQLTVVQGQRRLQALHMTDEIEGTTIPVEIIGKSGEGKKPETSYPRKKL